MKNKKFLLIMILSLLAITEEFGIKFGDVQIYGSAWNDNQTINLFERNNQKIINIDFIRG
ncbi:hypothetical protein ISS07_04515 [Candidatus Woesearchaeota archaeon]|nr:hypothetical protein [Candidatus Woesearchaeota archaeon]